MTAADTYETYADRTDEPRFSDWLRERSEPAFSEAVEHPFILDLGAGTLDADAFAEYLLQDYAFLESLVGAFGFAVGEAPGIDSKRPLVEFLDVVTDEESDYFERSFEALDVPADRYTAPERTGATDAFVDLLERVAVVSRVAIAASLADPPSEIAERGVAATVGGPVHHVGSVARVAGLVAVDRVPIVVSRVGPRERVPYTG